MKIIDTYYKLKMDEQSIFYQSEITELFHKNLYTFIDTEYKYIKNNIIKRIDIYIEVNYIINNIIDNINNESRTNSTR